MATVLRKPRASASSVGGRIAAARTTTQPPTATAVDATRRDIAQRHHRRENLVKVRSLSRFVGLSAMGIAVVCGVTACSTDDAEAQTPTTSSSTTSSLGGTEGGAMAAIDPELQACLEENGVSAPPTEGSMPTGEMPSGPPPSTKAESGDSTASGGAPGSSDAPPGVDADVWAAAQQACSA